jgi:hypothetical protein
LVELKLGLDFEIDVAELGIGLKFERRGWSCTTGPRFFSRRTEPFAIRADATSLEEEEDLAAVANVSKPISSLLLLDLLLVEQDRTVFRGLSLGRLAGELSLLISVMALPASLLCVTGS